MLLANNSSQVLFYQDENNWVISKPLNFVIKNLREGKGLGSNTDFNLGMSNIFWYFRSARNHHLNFQTSKSLEYSLEDAIWWSKGKSGLNLGQFEKHPVIGYKSSWNDNYYPDVPIRIYIDDFLSFKLQFLKSLKAGDWLTMDFGLVDHHAIYAGDSHVIERNYNEGYIKKPLEWNWEWEVYKSPENDQHRKTILERAESKLTMKYDYNILTKNCDSFCNYCYYKSDISWQTLSFAYLFGKKLKKNIYTKQKYIYPHNPHGYEVIRESNDKRNLYSAVALTSVGWIPGKAIDDVCYYMYLGVEYNTSKFRVTESDKLSQKAIGVPQGKIFNGNVDLWCSVAHTSLGLIPGYTKDAICYYSYLGKEYATSEFQYIISE